MYKTCQLKLPYSGEHVNFRFDVVRRTSASYKLLSLVQIYFPNSFRFIKSFRGKKTYFCIMTAACCIFSWVLENCCYRVCLSNILKTSEYSTVSCVKAVLLSFTDSFILFYFSNLLGYQAICKLMFKLFRYSFSTAILNISKRLCNSSFFV